MRRIFVSLDRHSSTVFTFLLFQFLEQASKCCSRTVSWKATFWNFPRLVIVVLFLVPLLFSSPPVSCEPIKMWRQEEEAHSLYNIKGSIIFCAPVSRTLSKTVWVMRAFWSACGWRNRAGKGVAVHTRTDAQNYIPVTVFIFTMNFVTRISVLSSLGYPCDWHFLAIAHAKRRLGAKTP